MNAQGSQSAAHGNALPFAALNGALVTDVACVVVPAGVHIQQPLHILYLSTGEWVAVDMALAQPAVCYAWDFDNAHAFEHIVAHTSYIHGPKSDGTSASMLPKLAVSLQKPQHLQQPLAILASLWLWVTALQWKL